MHTSIQPVMHDDGEREREIERLSALIVQLGMCAQARVLAAKVAQLVKQRPPAMVTRMERDRGLA